MKIVKDLETKSKNSPRLQRERFNVYSSLHVWDDEDTQVSKPILMADLVNDSPPRRQRKSS